MKDHDDCLRCGKGPVHRDGDASQCVNCGAYRDQHHTYQPELLTSVSPRSLGESSGVPAPEGLIYLRAAALIPDLNLTH